MQAAEPLLTLSDVATELVGFLASFLAAGAVGFRYSALRGRLTESGDAGAAVWRDSARRAAALGLVGATVQAGMLGLTLTKMAAARHQPLMQVATASVPNALREVLVLLAVLGLLLAALRVRAGWPLAALGVVAGPLTGVLTGQWARLVNPVHQLVGGLWLGTLLMVVLALAASWGDARVRDRRGRMAADLVNGFSPLALTSGGVLALTGVITAWRHLTPFSSLWTTPYGYALIAKLCAVAVVFALGAYNWRRQRPTLGSDAGAASVRRSSTAELGVAGVVLVLTAILVSLPSPKRPGEGGPPAGAPAP